VAHEKSSEPTYQTIRCGTASVDEAYIHSSIKHKRTNQHSLGIARPISTKTRSCHIARPGAYHSCPRIAHSG
jgi:hypothetical protein